MSITQTTGAKLNEINKSHVYFVYGKTAAKRFTADCKLPAGNGHLDLRASSSIYYHLASGCHRSKETTTHWTFNVTQPNRWEIFPSARFPIQFADIPRSIHIYLWCTVEWKVEERPCRVVVTCLTPQTIRNPMGPLLLAFQWRRRLFAERNNERGFMCLHHDEVIWVDSR